MESFGPLQRTSVLGDVKDTAAQTEQGKNDSPSRKMHIVSCSEDSRMKQLDFS